MYGYTSRQIVNEDLNFAVKHGLDACCFRHKHVSYTKKKR